ncbi:MAG: corrinoid protein [Thermoflexales bacterium]|nr:corrinoid protein [Thermoflexales bacterium]
MDLKTLYDSVVNGEIEEVADGVNAALAAGEAPDRILNEALIPAMSEVGRLFEEQEYYVPEMLISAKAMQGGLAILKPLLAAAGAVAGPRVAFGTVKGDLHDIGKNLVIMMLEGAGYQVTDLGVDVSPDKFIAAAKDGAQIIGMSAMLTTTMPNMKVTIDALAAAGVRDGVKIMIGGAPLTQAYADQIGADGYSQDASSAVRKAKDLLG